MPINGIETVIFGTTDLSKLDNFFTDFGLVATRRDNAAVDFELPEGSHVLLRFADDRDLPPPFLKTDGPREIIWGVTDSQSLEQIHQELSKDRDTSVDPDGTVRCIDPNGLRIGFRLFERKPLENVEIVENTLTSWRRVNTMRKWYDRARPKLIQHIVFAVPDVDAAIDFYVERLKFRVSDMSRGRGVFLRSEGRNEHHNLFFLKNDLGFNHMAFGVDSIDELMAGANYLQRHGWKSGVGLGRHRISSIVFFYTRCPGGGEIEYAADGDFLDDNWTPKLWHPAYGNHNWVAEVREGSPAAPQEVEELKRPWPKFS